MSKNRRRGKDLERWVASDLGGRRVGILGSEDVSTPRFALECKERKKLPQFIKKTMAQAKANTPDGKFAAVVLHELNSSHEKDIVLMEYTTFRMLVEDNT